MKLQLNRLALVQLVILLVVFFASQSPGSYALAQDKPPAGLIVDKEKKTVAIPCKIALRKLPNLDQIYPLEVVATYPAPKGQKAHETVVTFETVKPSEVHRALEDLGLKPGKPARGEGAVPSGPEVRIFLELPGVGGGTAKRIPIEKTLIDKRTGKSLPPLKWFFTGSIVKQVDPAKPEMVYAADVTGTLVGIFPVTDEIVFQTNLTMNDEPLLKMDTNTKVLPDIGTPVQLIIQIP
jgi:hypothetical protein